MTRIGPGSLGDGGGHIQRFHESNRRTSQALERLSTGKRINRASDDPSGLIAAENLRGDLVVLSAESRVSDAERLSGRRKESALSQIQSVLNGVRGSLVSAADGSNSTAQSQAIQQSINASLDAIDRIADGVEGVSGSEALLELREGGSANVVDGDTAAAAELVDSKLSQITQARAAVGAYERAYLDTFDRIREDQIVINTQALSQIEDADFAKESSNFVQGQILAKASIAALAFSQREQVEQMERLLEGIDSEV